MPLAFDRPMSKCEHTMVYARIMKYPHSHHPWLAAARTLGLNIQGALSGETTQSKVLQSLRPFGWVLIGALCVAISGAVAGFGVFGLVDLLRGWTTDVSHAKHVIGAVCLGVLALSSAVVWYFLRTAQDE
jgi:hypothetical protein